MKKIFKDFLFLTAKYNKKAQIAVKRENIRLPISNSATCACLAFSKACHLEVLLY
jgi:hypothetical protein